jgi:hypothetical protein
MYELAMNKTIKIAPLHKLAFAAAARATGTGPNLIRG